jgi:hypothetical protein
MKRFTILEVKFGAFFKILGRLIGLLPLGA